MQRCMPTAAPPPGLQSPLLAQRTRGDVNSRCRAWVPPVARAACRTALSGTGHQAAPGAGGRGASARRHDDPL